MRGVVSFGIVSLMVAAPLFAAGETGTVVEPGDAPATQKSSVGAAVPPEEATYDPYFLGYETEPAMDYGGRDVASLDAGLSRLCASIGRARDHPGLAPTWEAPLGLILSVVQHEGLGHGGRAREFDLHPSYGAGLGLTFYTTVDKDPESNLVTVLLAAGGTEADDVLARRLVLDLYRPGGAEGSSVPLLLMAKLDLTLYALETTEPGRPGSSDSRDFKDQFKQGNDVAIYLVGRQAERLHADPTVVWERDYVIDFSDSLLRDTWRDIRATALWNFLDPSVGAAMYSYVRDHLSGGSLRIHPPVLRLSPRIGLTAGTRGILGPAYVSRFLDLYATTLRGVATLYARDLDSSIDRSYGWGIGIQRLRIVEGIEVGAQADFWREPRSLETNERGSHRNLGAELDLLVRSRWGFSVKGGYKTDGFFPGTPERSGTYAGFGLRAAL